MSLRFPRPASRRLAPCAFVLALLCGLADAGDAQPTLEERLSYKEFRAFGLDQLSAEQLKGLNDWLAAQGALTARPAAQVGAAAAAVGGDETASGDDGTLRARIAGRFDGWQNGTVLTLDDGSQWEVRDDETFRATRSENPAVSLQRGLMGGWTLSVEGHGEIAHVIRVGQPRR